MGALTHRIPAPPRKLLPAAVLVVLTGVVPFLFHSAPVAAQDASVKNTITMKIEGPAFGAAAPKIVPQIGHNGPITALSFAPDGKTLLTGAGDAPVVKQWDLSSGREIHTYDAGAGPVTALAHLPSSQAFLVATRGEDDRKTPGALALWETEKPQPVWSVNLKSGSRLTAISLAKDGGLALCAYAGDDPQAVGSLNLWDLASGRIRPFLRPVHGVRILAFSPDADRAVSVERLQDGEIASLWDVASGDLIRALKVARVLAVSPEGRRVVYQEPAGRVIVWDVVRDQTEHVLAPPAVDMISGFLLPGGRVMGLSRQQTDQGPSLAFWDLAAAQPFWQTNLPDAGQPGPDRQAFSPDGRLLALFSASDAHDGPGQGMIRILDTNTGALSVTLEGRNIAAGAAASPNSNMALLVGRRHARLWDTSTGRPVREYTLPGVTTPVAASPDGRRAAGATDPDAPAPGVVIWDLETGKQAPPLASPQPGQRPTGLTFTPDSRRFLAAADGPTAADQTAMLGDPAGGKIQWSTGEFSGNPLAVAVSADGRQGFIGSSAARVHVFDLATGERRTVMRGSNEFNRIQALTVSPDGKRLLTGGSDSSVALWDLEQGQEVRLFYGHEGGVRDVRFSREGRLAVSASDDGWIKLWDVAQAQEMRTLKGENGPVTFAAFSPDERQIWSRSDEGGFSFWDLATGNEIARIVYFDDDEWVAVTADGFFNSSPDGFRFMNVRAGEAVRGLSGFYQAFFRPDLVERAMKGLPVRNLARFTLQEAITQPPPAAEIAPVSSPGASERILVNIAARSQGGGIGEVRVYHNGKLALLKGDTPAGEPEGAGRPLAELTPEVVRQTLEAHMERLRKSDAVAGADQGARFQGTAELRPVTGVNRMAVVAANRDGSVDGVPAEMHFTSEHASQPPRLFILCLGIGKYRNPNMGRAQAAADAEAVAQALARAGGARYGPDHVHIKVLGDDRAAKPGILAALNDIVQTARPEDEFVLFATGLGALAVDRFALVAADSDGTFNPNTMVEAREWIQFVAAMPALRQFYLFDLAAPGGMDAETFGLYEASLSTTARKAGITLFGGVTDMRPAERSLAVEAVQAAIGAGGSNRAVAEEARSRLLSLARKQGRAWFSVAAPF